MMEIWKDVLGWEGIYKVSSYGRLVSYKDVPEGRLLSNTNNKGDYISVVLSAKGRPSKSTRMHRLVAETFISNPHGLLEVNHIDGNRQNNRVENLEWNTRKQNADDMKRRSPHYINKMVQYNKSIRPKRVQQLSLDGVILATFDTAKAASEATGVCHRNILQICHGQQRRTQAGGYKWAFEGEVMLNAT